MAVRLTMAFLIVAAVVFARCLWRRPCNLRAQSGLCFAPSRFDWPAILHGNTLDLCHGTTHTRTNTKPKNNSSAGQWL